MNTWAILYIAAALALLLANAFVSNRANSPSASQEDEEV